MTATARTMRIRRTVTILFFVGLVTFLAIMGVAGSVSLMRHLRTIEWNPALANIDKIEELCDVQHEYGSGWRTMAVMECAEAPGYIEEQRNFDRFGWRSRENKYATISYQTETQRITTRIQLFRISSLPVEEGETIAIYVDPADPDRIERPNGPGDMTMLLWAAAIAIAIWVSVVLVGWMIVHVYDGTKSDPRFGRQPR